MRGYHGKSSDVDDELARLRLEHVSLKDSSTMDASEVVKLRLKVSLLQKDLDRTLDGLSDRDKCIKERDAEMKAARLKIEQLLAKLTVLQEDMTRQSSAMEADVAPLKVRINELEAELTKTKSTLNSQSGRLRLLEDELACKHCETDAFRGQMQRLEVEASHNLDALKKSLDDSLIKLAAEKAKCTTLEVCIFFVQTLLPPPFSCCIFFLVSFSPI